ncbi:hypothetical protein Goari_002874 [Gossypium aridum]|uniref:Uncharacterized protein n=1 Tax=Gossypium aridum TaxID=34290 RepID=A0A7J8YB93_GOSAI|nr:hypothetical protein [Gossypium aridum]
MAQQFGNFIGQFVKYDASITTRGVKRFIRVRDRACLRFLPVKANAGRSRGGVWLGKFIKGRAKKDNVTSPWLREEPKEGIRVGGRSNRDR